MSQDRPHASRSLRYVWLVYLGSLFFQPVVDSSADPGEWLAVAVLIGLFLPIYAGTFRVRDQRRTVLLIAAFGALALAGSVVNSGASVFVIYGASTAGRLRPARRAVTVIAVLVGLVVLMAVISPAPMPWRLAALAPALFFTPAVGAASILDAERRRAERRLRRANEEIERLATIAERERIARDLHDLLGHTLSVIVLKSELAARLVHADPDRATAEVDDIERIGRAALGEVRAAVTGYRARGLDAEIGGARIALEAAGVDVDVRADPPDLGPEQESALAMALREAVTNVVRHAGARHATIALTTAGSDVRLEVGDDGRGWAGMAGSGITGMHERIAAMGGRVRVGPPPGEDGRPGTVVEVTVPMVRTTTDRHEAEERGGP